MVIGVHRRRVIWNYDTDARIIDDFDVRVIIGNSARHHYDDARAVDNFAFRIVDDVRVIIWISRPGPR